MGLALGPPVSCGHTMTRGQTAPGQLWGFQELFIVRKWEK